MPEVSYTTTMPLPPAVVWHFVKDMNNWAPLLTGYQGHEALDETDSVWTLRGDVGVLARTVRLRARVTEWNGPERVAFTLSGLNEPVEGGGTLVMAPDDGARLPVPEKSFWRRFIDAVFRFAYRLRYGAAPRIVAASAARNGTRLTFTLRMDAGGPTGPVVNAMLGPAMLPAAEDLANKIAAHLEKHHGK